MQVTRSATPVACRRPSGLLHGEVVPGNHVAVAKVMDISSAKVERLVPDLAAALRAHGNVIAVVADIESVDIWRQAARRTGRLLGWRVATKVSPDGARVWCVSEDFPTPPGSDRTAANLFGSLLHQPTRRD